MERVLGELRHGHYYKIERTEGGSYVMNSIGTSALYPRARGILEGLREKFKRNKIRKVIFQCNKTKYVKNNIDKRIFALATKGKGMDRELRYASREELLFVWAKTTDLQDSTLRKKALLKLQKHTLRCFSLDVLPTPNITFSFDSTIDTCTTKYLCRRLTTRTLEADTAAYINKNLRIIPTKQKSIAGWLVNTKRITRQSVFTCAGQPWCRDGEHFSKDLKDMGEIFTQVGDVSAHYVPAQPDRHSGVKILIQWLKKLVIYKLGTGIYDEKMKSCMKATNLVNLYSDGRLVKNIPFARFKKLWENFISMTNTEDMEGFCDSLDECAERYKSTNVRNSWTTPPEVFDLVRSTFCLEVERMASPFDFNLRLNRYCSRYTQDEKFGSLGDTIENTWERNSFVNPEYTEGDISRAIKTAINSGKLNGIVTILLIPLWIEKTEYLRLLRDPTLRFICFWDRDTFKFVSPITYEYHNTVEWEVGLLGST